MALKGTCAQLKQAIQARYVQERWRGGSAQCACVRAKVRAAQGGDPEGCLLRAAPDALGGAGLNVPGGG